MRKTINFGLIVIFAFSAVSNVFMPAACNADFFKYKDNRGNLIITNRFEDVPKKYRNRVKVIWDSDLEAKDPVARRSTLAKEQNEKQEAERKSKQETAENRKLSQKGKTLVIEMDENSGQMIRRYE